MKKIQFLLMFVFSISLVSLNAQTTVNQTTDKKTCVKTAKCDKTTKTCNGIPCPPKCCKANGTSTSMADASNTNVSPSQEATVVKVATTEKACCDGKPCPISCCKAKAQKTNVLKVANKIEPAPKRASNTETITEKKQCSKTCMKKAEGER